ncbi:uncharacterized protein FTOL_10356 [Fusarium torulosum]|uniref:Uncharacterized protein n=1 Tax=Fusarium torulosum TaxID=33205 RepID=A0AAE8MGE7_9HYPO|nr:uncharacterized protein FTOL_10356 [Fusarium torulosum]
MFVDMIRFEIGKLSISIPVLFCALFLFFRVVWSTFNFLKQEKLAVRLNAKHSL